MLAQDVIYYYGGNQYCRSPAQSRLLSIRRRVGVHPVHSQRSKGGHTQPVAAAPLTDRSMHQALVSAAVRVFVLLCLLLARKLVAVCRKRFTKGIACAAAGGILMACAASLSGLLCVCGQCLRRFRDGNRHRSTDGRRYRDGPQDLKIHFIFSINMNQCNENSRTYTKFLDFNQHRRRHESAR
jgi:hypothetical protein